MFIVEEATHTFLYKLELIVESSHTLRTRFSGLMLCTTTLFQMQFILSRTTAICRGNLCYYRLLTNGGCEREAFKAAKKIESFLKLRFSVKN